MTPQALRFLRDLLGQQQIAANAPNLMELASMIFEVRKELDQALKEAEQ